jgi:hypothetical protein
MTKEISEFGDTNIWDAFREFIKTDEFKDIAKQKNSKGGRYRLTKTRFLRDENNSFSAIIWMLIEHGYTVNVSKNTP